MATEPDELLDLNQVCERLKLGKTTVITRMREGKLPGAFKVGREWRMEASDLRTYIDSLKAKQSATEPTQHE